MILGCSNADTAKYSANGKEHKIELWSGGQKVQEWTSTGKVENETDSDGFYFQDKETKKLVRVTGDVVITVK